MLGSRSKRFGRFQGVPNVRRNSQRSGPRSPLGWSAGRKSRAAAPAPSRRGGSGRLGLVVDWGRPSGPPLVIYFRGVSRYSLLSFHGSGGSSCCSSASRPRLRSSLRLFRWLALVVLWRSRSSRVLRPSRRFFAREKFGSSLYGERNPRYTGFRWRAAGVAQSGFAAPRASLGAAKSRLAPGEDWNPTLRSESRQFFLAQPGITLYFSRGSR